MSDDDDRPADCPWCGCETLVGRKPDRPWACFFVYCNNNSCSVIGPANSDRFQAIAAWNRIAASKAPAINTARTALKLVASQKCRSCELGYEVTDQTLIRGPKWWHFKTDRGDVACDAQLEHNLLGLSDEDLVEALNDWVNRA